MDWSLSEDEGVEAPAVVGEAWSLSASESGASGDEEGPPQVVAQGPARRRGRPKKQKVVAGVDEEEQGAVAPRHSWGVLARPVGSAFFQRCSAVLEATGNRPTKQDTNRISKVRPRESRMSGQHCEPPREQQ